MRVGAVHPGTHFFLQQVLRKGSVSLSGNQFPGAQSRLPSPLRARFMKSGGKSLRWNASSADSNGVRVLLGLIS
jgi:hypothetical protein